MNCPSCGHTNRDSAKFCEECGRSLAARCPQCDAEVRDTAKFCDSCGAPVAATAPEPARHEVRKVVTVVFVDLAGSTSLQEHMDPESVRRVMDRFYATMRAEVEAAGGVVVKFTGDGVMAGFGIRESGEDDALRAVRASTAMRDAFATFATQIAEDRGAAVSLRIGINTGEVVVSEDDDDVVGDVVNVAARLEHAAGDGNILVGEETRRLVRDAVTFEAVEPLELKGKAEPVPAYRLVSLEAPSDDEEAAAPFVGRSAELTRLHEVFERSVTERSPAIVTVVGSPGLGKTRIATEFTTAVGDRASVLEAACYAAGTATYAPIAEALRQAAGIPETAPEAEVVSALESLLPDDFPEADRVAKLTASLLGVGEAAAPQETFWATRRLLEGLAAVRPLVLVVDDVQWAEPMLLDLIDHLVEWVRDAAIVIIALARPEIREVRPSLVDAGAIVLEGLDPGDTAELAAGLLGAHDLPPELVGRILAATEGNPLFVRELLRMLVDDGVLSREGDRWTITVEAEAIEVPPTIHALLSSRIERLRDEERAVVERASVVGKEFYRGAVLELVPPQVGSGIDAHLETLRRKELVEPEGTYWIDERVFRFHHVLIRDAAYRRLLKEARAELHERFADWLERKVGDLVGEHEEVLGYHLEQAYVYRTELGTTDDHTADLGRRAAAHLASATHRALDRDDLAAAAQLSARALALTDDPRVRTPILLDRCEALLGMGQVGLATAAVGELRAQAGDERLTAWATCFDGQLAVLTDPSRLRETAELVEDAARRLEQLGEVAGAAKAHAVHAQALAHLGQFGACEAALDRALAAARQAGDRRRANAVLAAAPVAALWGPNPVPRASGRCLDVVRVLRITAGAPAVEATALRCQAILEAMRGRTEAAHRMLASSRKTLEELGLRHALVECDLSGGLIDLFSGDAAGAEAKLRAAQAGFQALNVGTDTALTAALLARTLVDLDRDDEALELTDQSEQLGGDDLKTAIAWRTVRARVLARREELEAALELARAAVALAEPTDALIDHADARLALAEVLRAAGREQEAVAEERLGAELYAGKEATLGSTPLVEVPGGVELEVADSRSSQDVRAEASGRVGGVRAAPGVGVDLSIWERGRDAKRARDHEAVRAQFAPDYVFVTRRSGLRSETVGVDAYLEGTRAAFQDVVNDWDAEVLAAWSDNIFLSRITRFGDGWEIGSLAVRVMRDGVWCRDEIFDEDDFEGAFTRLDELSYETSAAKPIIDRYTTAPNGHGWEEVVPVVATGSAALVRAGGSLAVVDTAEGEVTDVELFDGDDELGARTRLYEVEPHTSHVRWVAQYYVDANNARDWEGVRRHLEADAEIHDRRPIGWGRVDVDSTVEHLQEAARSTRSFTLEVRDWISLTPDRSAYVLDWSGVTREGADFEYPRIMVATFSPRGLTSRATVLEVDQLDEARRLLSTQVVEIGPVTGGYAEIFNEREWGRAEEFFAPDYVVVDHRPAALGRRDLTGLVDGLKAFVDLAPNIRVHLEPIYTSPSAEVAILHMRGDTREGAEFLLDIGAATRVVDGFGVAAMTFVPEDAEAATRWATDHSIGFEREDFEALRRAAGAPVELGYTVAAYVEMFNARDWDRITEFFAPDYVLVDHRAAGFARRDIEAWVQGMRVMVDLSPNVRVEVEPVFTSAKAEVAIYHFRGEALEGGEFVLDMGGASRIVDGIGITGITCDPADVDAAIRWATDHSIGFEKEDFDALRRDAPERDPAVAVDEALGRFGELRQEHEPEVVRAVHRVCQMYSDHDWDAFRFAYDEDVVVVDHRPASWGAFNGNDHLVGLIRGLVDLVPDASVVCRSIERLSGETCLAIVHMSGTDTNGAVVEMTYYSLFAYREGRFTRWEQFPIEEREAAVARFEELTQEDEPTTSPSATTPSNAYTRVYRAFHDTLRRGDWEAAEALQAADIVLEDRRSGLRDSLAGRAELLRNQREALKLGYTLDRFEPIATRGDRLALVRILWVLGEDSEIEMRVVGEMDEQDRISALVVFDPDDLDSALAELDERYDATLPASLVGVRKIGYAVTEAYNSHDWDGLIVHYAPDVTVIDHRPAGWGARRGADDFVTLVRALADLVPDVSLLVSSIDAMTEMGMASTVSITGTDRNGASVELTYIVVWTLREGVIEHYEVFPTEQRGEAVARLEELTAEVTLRTTVERAWEQVLSAKNERDMGAMGELLAPDYRLRDHIFHCEYDRDGAIEDLERVLRGAGSFGTGRVFTFGDRHGLFEMTWTRGEGRSVGESAMTKWNVNRCDGDGRFLVTEWYAESDLAEALARTEELYLEDEATGDEATWSRARLERLWPTFAALDAGRLDGFLSLPSDYVTIDHRPGGLGELRGRDAWSAWKRAMSDVALHSRYDVRSVRFERNVVLLDMAEVGVNKDGGSFEIPALIVLPIGAARQEVFAPEQREEAERRFRELVEESRPSASTASSTTIERSWDRFIAAMNARDFGELAEMLDPGFRVSDHIYHFELDRDGQLANLERILVGRSSFRQVQAVVLGDRHGVMEFVWTSAPGGTVGESVVITLAVQRCDAEGRFLVCEFFAETDVLESLERAEELYLEDEATGDDAVWSRNRLERLWRSFRAYNAGDLDAFAEQAPPDFVTIDHRPGSLAEFPTRDAWLTWLRAMPEVALDWRFEIRSVRFERDVVLLEMASAGTNTDGGSFESPLLNVVVPGVRQEIYLPEQRDEAERRFRELVKESRHVAETEALTTIGRSWYRLMRAFEERDLREVGELYAADVRVRDHVHHLELDREGALKSLEVVMGQPGSFGPGQVFYLGDRHAVGQMIWTGSAGAIGDSVVLNWNVARCGSDGMYLLIESFGESDTLRALERAEEVYLEDEASGREAVASRSRSVLWRAMLSYNDGDWDGVSAGFAPDLVTIDHRPMAWGRLEGRAPYIDLLRSLADIASERRWVVRSAEFEGAVVLVHLDVVGADADGGPFVLPFVAVLTLSESGATRQELFAPEQRDEAERRFGEMRGSGVTDATA